MIEIIILGRGGLGAKSCGEILADAAIASKNYPNVSAFPSFGTERRGAPVLSFCRISETPIWTRAHVAKADYILVLDETVFGPQFLTRIKNGGTLIFNSSKKPEKIRLEYDFGRNPVKIMTADLTQIAFDLKLTTRENHPIVNTSILGVLTLTSLEITLDDAARAIEKKFGKSVKTDLNIKAARVAAEKTLKE